MEQLKELREKVIKANRIYEEVRKQARIPEKDEYRRRTIKELSDPFVKGVFTLAVIGPMSAGKSAFINALLGDDDLLPTGHFQTTCTLTEISYSTEKRLKIVYGDGHIDDSTNGEGVLAKLKGIVSIPEEYDKLPINHINQFILAGNTYEEILNNKNVLLELSGRSFWEEGDDELLKKYVESKKTSNIPVHVYLSYPLEETYKGWRIVDTPGIGAIGGIDQTTKDFLCSEDESIDAAIFIFKGSEGIEKKEINEIVNSAYSQLTDVAKERTFFVITHKGMRECINNLEKTKQKAIQLFSKGKVSIPEERFLSVDSMLSLLHDISIKKYGLDPMIFTNRINVVRKYFRVEEIDNQVERKDKEEKIDNYRDMIHLICDELDKKEIEINSEVLTEEICSFAEFAKLRNMLGDFAVSAKKDAYINLKETIIEDFKSFGSHKDEEIELKQLKITKTPEEFEQEIAAKMQQIINYSQSLQEKFINLQLGYNAKKIKKEFYATIVDETKERINTARSLFMFQMEEDIENAINNYLSSVKYKDESVFKSYVLDCERLTKDEMEDKIPGIALEPVDTRAVVKQVSHSAELRATHPVEKEKWETTNKFIRFISLGLAGKKKVSYFVDEVNWKEKIDNTKADAIAFVESHIGEHCLSIQKSVIVPSGVKIQEKIDNLVNAKNEEYNSLVASEESEKEIWNEIHELENIRNMILSKIEDVETL